MSPAVRLIAAIGVGVGLVWLDVFTAPAGAVLGLVAGHAVASFERR